MHEKVVYWEKRKKKKNNTLVAIQISAEGHEYYQKSREGCASLLYMNSRGKHIWLK